MRKEYENIFQEIEGDDSECRITWSSDNVPISYPKFISKKDQQILSTSNVLSLKKTDIYKKLCVKDFQAIDDFEKISFLELDNLKRLSKSDLISVRENVSLEMLWIKQAIQSRIQVIIYEKDFFNRLIYFLAAKLFFI